MRPKIDDQRTYLANSLFETMNAAFGPEDQVWSRLVTNSHRA